jgi:hypothetical protein
VTKLLRLAIVLAAAGIVLCLWLLARVAWYNFFLFMVVAQPLLLAAFVLFAIALLQELAQRKGV